MIIAWVSQKGGVGKTTLSTACAWELATRGLRVLLVDTDPQKNATGMCERAGKEGRTVPFTLVQMGKELYLPDQLPKLAESFDFVVLDTPPTLLGGTQSAAVAVADLALVPLTHCGGEIDANEGTLELIEKVQPLNPRLQTALVYVRKLPTTSMAKKYRRILEGSGLPVLRSETTFRISWQEAHTAGVGVAQYAPKDKAAAEVRALVDEILGMASQQREVANG